MDEALVVAEMFRDRMVVYGGDRAQTPGGIGAQVGAHASQRQLLQRAHGLHLRYIALPHDLPAVFKEFFGRGILSGNGPSLRRVTVGFSGLLRFATCRTMGSSQMNDVLSRLQQARQLQIGSCATGSCGAPSWVPHAVMGAKPGG